MNDLISLQKGEPMDRDEFMELVYETFADEPDNVLANGIIEAADAYAEHEKAQLSCEGTTSDRISGIDTISVLEIFTQTDTLGHTPRKIVEAPPSAQPDHNADISKKAEGDCISRQAAIDLFPNDALEWDTKDGYIAPHLARRMICELSSAQPERKKPVFKTGESVYHVSYADGTGGFEKNKWADWTCPDCGWFVGEQYIPRRHNQQKCNYCAKCGCAIDWSDADMRGEQDG